MKCMNCGEDSSPDAKYCENCGHILLPDDFTDQTVSRSTESSHSNEVYGNENNQTITPTEIKEMETSLERIFPPNKEEGIRERWERWKQMLNTAPVVSPDTICPVCEQDNCTIFVKSITDVKNHGYRWGSGLCGMCLMGPFGLLCGLCGTGSEIHTKDETWWICPSCGKKHISQQTALEKSDLLVSSIFTSCFAIGCVLSLLYYTLDVYFILWWIIFISGFAVPISLWANMISTLDTELGFPVIDILSPEQKKSWVKKFILSIVLVVAIQHWGLPLLYSLLGG